MIIISGGTGTPKLIDGLLQLIDTKSEKINIIVNTADDIIISDLYISPDIDTIIYLFLNILNKETWWGIRNDTFNTYSQLKNLNIHELLKIGDQDRAISIFRTSLLKKNYSLSESIKIICNKLNLNVSIFPMTNEKVTTIIKCQTEKSGLLQIQNVHYQEYLMKPNNKKILSIKLKNINNCKIPNDLLSTLNNEDFVIIGPSNPITSIGPVLQIPKMREILMHKHVIVISPIISKSPISGPLGSFMNICKYPVSSKSIIDIYKDIMDIFIYDESDSEIDDKIIKKYQIEYNIKFIKTNILLDSNINKLNLGRLILSLKNK